jgi:hypothetical protein
VLQILASSHMLLQFATLINSYCLLSVIAKVIHSCIVGADMVSTGQGKGKGNVTFRQRALMFTSRGELSTATMAEVLSKRAESNKSRPSQASSSRSRSARSGTDLPSSASVPESLTPRSSANLKSNSDGGCQEVHCLSDSTAPMETVPNEQKRKRAKANRRYSIAALDLIASNYLC